MELINPFEEIGKADTWPAQSATIIRALVPTGRNVGHGLDLKHVRVRTKGPRRPALEVYGRRKGVSKAYNPFKPRATKNALKQIGDMKAPSKPPGQTQSPRVGAALRDRKARRAESERFWSAASNASTSGRRI